MTDTVLTVHAAYLSRGRLALSVENDAGRLSTVLDAAELPDWEAAARWLLPRCDRMAERSDAGELRRRLTLSWHEENGVRVLDGYAVEELGESAALAELLASPLATVTVAEADAWVDANVADLASAREYLKRVNAVVLTERDILLALLRRLREAGIV